MLAAKVLVLLRLSGRWVSRFFLGRSLDPLAQMPLGVAKPQARDLNGRVNIDYLLSWLRQSAADKVREALRTSPCTALSASNPPWLDA